MELKFKIKKNKEVRCISIYENNIALGCKDKSVLTIDVASNKLKCYLLESNPIHVVICGNQVFVNTDTRKIFSISLLENDIKQLKYDNIVLIDSVRTRQNTVLALSQSSKLLLLRENSCSILKKNIHTFPTKIFYTNNLIYLYNSNTNVLLMLDSETFEPIKLTRVNNNSFTIKSINYSDGEMCFHVKDKIILSNGFYFFPPSCVKNVKFGNDKKVFCCTKNDFIKDGVTIFKSKDAIECFDVCDNLCVLCVKNVIFIFEI